MLHQRTLARNVRLTSPSLHALPSTDETSPRSSIVLLKRLVREHVRPYLGKLGLAALAMIVVAAATGANAWLLQPAIDEIFIARSTTMLWLVPAAVVVVAIVKGGSGYCQRPTKAEIRARLRSRSSVAQGCTDGRRRVGEYERRTNGHRYMG